MYKFNLNGIDNENIEIIKDYLNSNRISKFSLEYLAEMSFKENCYENSNFIYFLDSSELSIIHFDIFLKNKETTLKILSLEDEENILLILQISIKEELITRFKDKIENNLKKDDYKIDKIKKL